LALELVRKALVLHDDDDDDDDGKIRWLLKRRFQESGAVLFNIVRIKGAILVLFTCWLLIFFSKNCVRVYVLRR